MPVFEMWFSQVRSLEKACVSI